jgi:CRISPR/Cas system-associated exonuclease Cas4 (RecB family)
LPAESVAAMTTTTGLDVSDTVSVQVFPVRTKFAVTGWPLAVALAVRVTTVSESDTVPENL